MAKTRRLKKFPSPNGWKYVPDMIASRFWISCQHATRPRTVNSDARDAHRPGDWIRLNRESGSLFASAPYSICWRMLRSISCLLIVEVLRSVSCRPSLSAVEAALGRNAAREIWRTSRSYLFRNDCMMLLLPDP